MPDHPETPAVEKGKTHKCGQVTATLDPENGGYLIKELGVQIGKGHYLKPGVLVIEVYQNQRIMMRTFLAIDEESVLEDPLFPLRLEAMEMMARIPGNPDVRMPVIRSSVEGIGEVIRIIHEEQEDFSKNKFFS